MLQPPCERLASELPALFACSAHDDRVRIRTPFLYPDGDLIDLFYVERNGSVLLTDLGETVRWLRMQTVASRRSPKQQQMIAEVCINHGVELFKGMLTLRLLPGETLAPAVIRLAQASVRVSDLWFTMRTRAVETLTDEVGDFLADRKIPFERGAKMTGRSGRAWDVDYVTRTPEQTSLVYLLSTGSRASARKVVEHAVAAWYDLNYLKVLPQPVKLISLFDDELDVWQEEDFRLVEQLSTIARWSRPDEFENELRPAA
jgi:hypothetical protein